MKTHCLQHKDLVIAWVRIILALGTNHLNFGYESSGYETSGKRGRCPPKSTQKPTQQILKDLLTDPLRGPLLDLLRDLIREERTPCELEQIPLQQDVS